MVGTWDPKDPKNLWNYGPPGTSGPHEPREITSTLEIHKHPGTLKVEH